MRLVKASGTSKKKYLPHQAREWLRVRSKGLLDIRPRYDDRRIFADGELGTWIGPEQTATHAREKIGNLGLSGDLGQDDRLYRL